MRCCRERQAQCQAARRGRAKRAGDSPGVKRDPAGMIEPVCRRGLIALLETNDPAEEVS